MSRALRILAENAETIDAFIQQMDQFAADNGGYMNRAGVGNWRTDAEDEVDEKMSRAKRIGLGAGTVAAGAAHLANKAVNDPNSPTGAAVRKGAGMVAKGVKTAAKHYGVG